MSQTFALNQPKRGNVTFPTAGGPHRVSVTNGRAQVPKDLVDDFLRSFPDATPVETKRTEPTGTGEPPVADPVTTQEAPAGNTEETTA